MTTWLNLSNQSVVEDGQRLAKLPSATFGWMTKAGLWLRPPLGPMAKTCRVTSAGYFWPAPDAEPAANKAENGGIEPHGVYRPYGRV